MEEVGKQAIKLRDRLQSIVWPTGEPHGVMQVKELPQIIGVAPSTTYDKIKHGRLTAPEFIALSRTYGELGELGLIELCLPAGHHVINHKCNCTNGTLEDESQKLFKTYGKAAEYFDKGDFRNADRMMVKAEEILHDAKLEVERAGK